MKPIILLIALSPGGETFVPLNQFTDPIECGQEIAEYANPNLLQEGWSFHCRQTSILSSSIRPILRRNSSE